MKTRTLYGRTLHPEALPSAMVTYLPDDYEFPCYRITVVSSGHSAERCTYYANVLVDSELRIWRIERYKDNYMVNSPVTVFPPAMEAAFAVVMEAAT